MLDEIRTLPDHIIDEVKDYYAKNKKYITLDQLSKNLKLKKAVMESWVEFLDTLSLLEIDYPFNIFASPRIKALPPKVDENNFAELNSKVKELVSEYKIFANKLECQVKIWKIPSEDVSIYELKVPKLGAGTKAMLEGITDVITKTTTISTEDISDPKKMLALLDTYFIKLSKEVKKKIPDEKQDVVESLASVLLHSMYGLDIIDVLLADDLLEEIAINGSEVPISVYHRKVGWLKTLIFLETDNSIFNIAEHIGRKSGQQINSLNPIMDARLLIGDRVAATLYPISTNGNTITIRRFARKPWTITQFANPKTGNIISKEIAAFIWMAMQYELNVIIAGGTASGKTSMLNVLCSFIQPTNRLITIEDTREIELPDTLHWNWVPLTGRSANAEGQGEISMLDLIIASLRMRPDRIIVGEIRRKQQAQALFEAMHTGHSVYATMHADTAQQVKRRLLEPPIEVPKTELGSLHLIVIQYRDRRTGKRRTLEVAEVIDNKDDIDLNLLYRWHPRSDTFERVNRSKRIMEDLSLHTGMTPKDIDDDLKEKEIVLQWMMNDDVTDVDQIGLVLRKYYKDKEKLLEAIKAGKKFAQVIDKSDYELKSKNPWAVKLAEATAALEATDSKSAAKSDDESTKSENKSINNAEIKSALKSKTKISSKSSSKIDSETKPAETSTSSNTKSETKNKIITKTTNNSSKKSGSSKVRKILKIKRKAK